MKRIGITQRVITVGPTNERRDCLDQRWAALLAECECVPVPLANAIDDVAAYMDALNVTGVVLSGGNDMAAFEGATDAAPERDRFELALIDYCVNKGIPLFGVCRGMQVLNHFCEGGCVPIEGHVGNRHRVRAKGTGPFAEERNVNSFHNYAIRPETLGTGIEAMSMADDGSIEAIRALDGLAFGVMWHPEREEPFDSGDVKFFRKFFNVDD